jgi:glycine betaine/proline transport system permease protein
LFDWLQDNGAAFFDALSDALDWLIEAILWVLQTPHPLIVVAAFVALTYALQRSWKTARWSRWGSCSSSIRAIGRKPPKA